jgi:hypothetical protein
LYSQAQLNSYSNLKKKKIATSGVVRLDSLSIVPKTIVIKGVDTSYYFIDAVKAVLIWKKKPSVDSVEIVYRTFPFKLDAEVKRLNYDSVRNNFISQPFIFNKNNAVDNSSGLFDFGNINYNGSFGRSMSFGNNQDAVFNSQLNLQLSGYIGDSIQIAAAITDNNIPLQPDGTTQQLNEFDKILLQFKKKNWEINLGDIDIRQNQNYFLNFYKRLQGISYQQQSKIGANGSNKLLTSGAIAKGKFTRNVFQGLEGNQGPYKLQGANNELYFVVLANTERVFIDGELLQRGEDQDYVINYNTSEITFTPKRMITKDRRIQVEFEYADRNYLNSLLYASDELQLNRKLKINVAAYSNADAKNSPINQTLDSKQTQFLANLGDSVQYAYYPIAAIDSFSVTKILYKKIDTLHNSIHDSIYVYSTSPDSAKYNLNFVEVGANRGNYIALYNGANGKVYQWVAPVNGIKQGNFEPATFLVTPKKQQIITVGAEYKINNKTLLKAETAISNYDANTFSSKDKSDNSGFAGKFLLQRQGRLMTNKKPLQLKELISYEYVSERFKPLERLRSVEFARDWGLSLTPSAATEQLASAGIEIKDSLHNFLLYNISGYFRSDNYNGIKQNLQYLQTVHNWQLKANVSLTNNSTLDYKGYFFRPIIEVNKLFPQLKNYSIGANYFSEYNVQRSSVTDTLIALSYSNDNVSAFIKSNQLKNNRWSFTYTFRQNTLPYQKSLLQTDKSNNYNLSAEVLSNKKHQLRFNLTYRELTVANSFLTNLTPDKALLGRTEYIINEWNGFVTGNALYEVGSGQEQKRDYSYVQVPPGQGQYTWNDYNGDGIPQLNEFELALFADQATFVRVYTPTNVYVKSDYTQFNYSININPRALANKIHNKNLKNFITRFNLQSAMQTGKKVLSNGGLQINPFSKNINDTALINLTNVLSNTISFNRFSSSWGVDLSNVRNYNKSLLTYGLQSRQISEWTMKGRINIKRSYTLELVQKLGETDLITPSFNNQNYQLKIISTEPKLSYISGTTFRIQASYQYINKQNSIMYGAETSTNNSFNLEGKFNAVQSGSITARFTYSNISFAGTPNTTTSYIMLDGLLPGKNYLWNIEFTKRIANYLEINFSYEGRKPGETRVINIGRASVRALL